MGPASKAQLFHEWARTYELRSDWPNAEKYSQQALIERQKLGAETMSVALNLGYIGLLAMNTLMTASATGLFRTSARRPLLNLWISSLTAAYSFAIGVVISDCSWNISSNDMRRRPAREFEASARKRSTCSRPINGRATFANSRM